MKIIRVCLSRLQFARLAAFLACLALSSPLLAQAPPIAQRLSPSTVLYVEWRGTTFLAGADQENHVLQFLHDPALAPIWLAAAADFQRHMPKPASPAAAPLLTDVTSFLDNSLVFGIEADPNAGKAVAMEKPTSPFATFIVYDATGKVDLIQKWKSAAAANAKEPAEVTTYDFGGTSVEVRTQGKDVSYSALAANYFLFADRKQVIEDLIARFRGGDRPVTSLVQLSEYDQMRKYIGNNAALEIFGRIPDMSQWNSSDKNTKSIMQFSKGIHLERVHVMGAALSFDEEATRFRGAILGDTAPGGLFDLAGSSSTTFQAQPIAEAGSAFSMSRVNYAATYQVIRDAVFSNLEPAQAAQVGALEGAAQGYIGMSIPEALKLFTGEFASTTSYADDGTPEQVYAATIQKPEFVLRVLRAVIGTMIVNKDSSGSATILDIAYPYTDPATHQRRRKYYYVAVTPQMLIVAPRKALLRSAMGRLTPRAADPPAGVFANPQYALLRSRLPEKLSGLGGADLGQIPWGKLLQNFVSQFPQAGNKTNGQQPIDLSSLKIDTISNYLHTWVSGWWKDSNGVYFDSYIQ